MNPSQSKMARYAVAGLCGLALLLVIAWLALREPPPPSPDLPPVKAVTVSPSVPLFTPDNAPLRETPTNTVAESAPIPTNAATIYRQAFTLYNALSQEQKDLIGNWRSNVDTSVAAEVCDKIQPICNLMHQAATATNCDWGLEQPFTVNISLPHLNPSRNLARVAVWSAGHCRTNAPSAAVDDLVAASRLGQKVALTPVLIGHLLNLSIQNMVIDSAASQASTLAGDPRLVQLLNGADYNQGLRYAIEQEAGISERTADAMLNMSSEDVTNLLASFFAHSSTPLTPMEPAQAIADIRQVADLKRQYAQTLELPETDYHEWLTSQETVRNTNPFAEDFLSSIERSVSRTQAMTVYNAMAVAGLSIMQDGLDVLPSHPDPTTGQPFTFRQTPDGFELESSFQVLNKSLKLSFK